MESLSNINLKQYPNLSCNLSNRPSFTRPISSISFKSPFSPTSLSSVSIRMQASSSQSDSRYVSPNPKTPLSLLKTPFRIAVAAAAAAAALFLCRFTPKPMLALAAPVSTEENVVSEEEREKTLEEYLASNPDDVQALKELMEAKIKNKKLPEAIEVASRLIELQPDEIEWQLLKCHMYTYTGEIELAKRGFEEILANDPYRAEAYHGLVMAVSQSESEGVDMNGVVKRIQGAMERCKKEKRNDEVRDFKLLIAQVRVIEGNYDEALKIYQELVKDEPRDFRPYLCQGIIYTLLRKKDEAEKQFEKYKRLVPKGHPYAQYFDDNMLATKLFSQMAENQRTEAGART